MKLHIAATIEPIKGGIEARSPDLRLAAHGLDAEDAIDSLRTGVAAWCVGLQRAGRLERTLRRRGLRWGPGGEAIMVVIEREDE